MRIKSLRVRNYKSFHDSGSIKLADRFNIVVGQNSSGKTALVEAFRFHRIQNKPTLLAENDPNEPLDPSSTIEFEATFSRGELKNQMLRSGFQVSFPVAPNQSPEVVHKFFKADENILSLKAVQHGINAQQYPSHGLFSLSERRHMQVTPKADKQGYDVSSIINNDADNLPQLAQQVVEQKVYVFRAERMAIGEIAFQEDRLLAENAGNLPRMLMVMSANPALFARYKRHVNQIFPYIKDITIVPKGGNIEIRIWWVEPKSERMDLAIPLLESGTGVSQVLSILYVAMTIQNGIIVIDEPNAFLNSGAAKMLVGILSQYDHQYILSTHSPEIISAATPAKILTVKWDQGKSSVEEVDVGDTNKQQQLLADLGVSASDLFGLENVVWVEGPTEQECFALILQKQLSSLPQGLAFVSVRSVDEIARKQGVDTAILDIYQRLTASGPLLPKAKHFSFDREKRSEEYIAKLERDTQGRVKFLPARHYECFLIHLPALATLISRECARAGRGAIPVQAIEQWFSDSASKFDGKWQGKLDDPEWTRTVDASAMLDELFQHFLLSEYRKTTHSFALTEWLLENDSAFLSYLTAYVVNLAT